jgi:hypothetical protein
MNLSARPPFLPQHGNPRKHNTSKPATSAKGSTGPPLLVQLPSSLLSLGDGGASRVM